MFVNDIEQGCLFIQWCVCRLLFVCLFVFKKKTLYLFGLFLNDNILWCFMSPEAQEKKKKARCVYTVKRKKEKKKTRV